MQSDPKEPEDLHLSPKRLEEAYSILGRAVEEGKIMGCTVGIARNGEPLEPRAFGRRSIEGATPVVPDTMFLIASLTKPFTSTAAMMLVERGLIRLDDPVCSIVPEFGDGGSRDRVLVRHLLTHTSGLPDQLPENTELRSHHATLDDFLRKIYRTPLLFEPGTSFSYQSCGMAMLMDIVQRVTGAPLSEFMLHEIFEPLGMDDSSLGVNWSKAERVSQVNLPPGGSQYGGAEASDWNWNSRYIWSLGYPWGGMFSTQADLLGFLNVFLNRGTLNGKRVVSPQTAQAMTNNQVVKFLQIPKDIAYRNPWGFGWQMKAPFKSVFGDLNSSRTFGHWGATGTLYWADPETSLACVVLTNQPFEWSGAILGRFSNAVAGSIAANP
ncbi:MAG: serine hydrolase domain-containing protein [Nitrososphaerales archaeon]|jgi:CubicO group peptidase (beta-lactamase class C family)